MERSHRIDAEEFYRLLDGVVIDDSQVFNDKLQEWEDFYNFHRPHGGLGGQTPYERLRQKTQAPRRKPPTSAAHHVWAARARANRKMDAVMRLLRGEPLDELPGGWGWRRTASPPGGTTSSPRGGGDKSSRLFPTAVDGLRPLELRRIYAEAANAEDKAERKAKGRVSAR